VAVLDRIRSIANGWEHAQNKAEILKTL
jgi:hypothetical protein